MKKLMLEKRLSSAFCVENGSTSSEVFVSTFIAILWKNLTIATSAIGSLLLEMDLNTIKKLH
ncbi:hypothetical protein Ocin01_19642, partial [Orchesella cincta]